MFLESLTVRGFKSFADRTTLQFEPGISVIVGPNGSGKSNVVDAISWVLGEQGPRSLRGGKMEDVLFAGSRLRPALGMAEVELTIDNAAGLLPIEFEEVRISRTLFRSGESEYRLNGAECRLLDIQELLSDTGVGREQHTIIGQGQLDAILTANPETLRGFIEEAAGVAKHRRRKERALRRIASTEHNLSRVSDLLSEIRRQLRPLREQAEVAQRYSEMAEELNRVRLVVGARELASLRGALGGHGLADLEAPIRSREEQLRLIEEALSSSERQRSGAFSAAESLRESAWALAGLKERLVSLERLALERERTLEAELAATTEAAAQARVAQLMREKEALAEEVEKSRGGARSARSDLEDAEEEAAARARAVADVERRWGEARSTQRDVSSDLLRIKGELAALAASIEAAGEESRRISDRFDGVASAQEEARAARGGAEEKIRQLEEEEAPLVAEADRLEAEISESEGRRAGLTEQLRSAEREAALWQARASRRHSSARAAQDLKGGPGVLGVLGELVAAPPELSGALTALAGDPAGVLVVKEQALRSLVSVQADAAFLVARRAEGIPGATPLAEALGVPPGEVADALSHGYLAADLGQARELAAAHPGYTFVTPKGGVASGNLVATSPEDSARASDKAAGRLQEVEASLSALDRSVAQKRDQLAELTRRLHRGDAQIAAAVERMAAADREQHALEREMAALQEGGRRSQVALESLQEKKASLEAKLPRVEAAIKKAESQAEELRQESSRASAEREVAVGSRDEARTRLAQQEERLRLLEERAARVEADLEQAQAASVGIEERRTALQQALERAGDVARAGARLAEAAGSWSGRAEESYRKQRLLMEEADSEANRLRSQRAELAGEIDDMRRRAREEDLGRSEQMIRARILEERMRQEWAADPDEAVARLGHQWEVEDLSHLEDPLERLAASDDDTLRRKRSRMERDLERIGGVNPLAEQEFRSLTEREEFLASQMSDLRRGRRHLLKVVAEVDARIEELFSDAFTDAAEQYERLFASLFPGGQGRLRLTDPKDLLASGVEVEARPGGKNLRRLSLLSGGEKALSALAFLFAIFRSRPSPFYVLDEVEAALDDINLQRFLGLLREFRDTSQLIVVTHQKRTMEVADVLYGISIRPDGASRVISQRLSDQFPGVPQSRSEDHLETGRPQQ